MTISWSQLTIEDYSGRRHGRRAAPLLSTRGEREQNLVDERTLLELLTSQSSNALQ